MSRRVLLLPLLLLLLLAFAPSSTRGHNITKILARHKEFSTFNHYLSATHLATEVNRRLTITVLALDNHAMSELLSKHMSIYTLKNVLSLHILADYFGPKRLHQVSRRSTLVASLFQATGRAPGTTGYVNITNLRGGKVGFGSQDNGGVLPARFVKSLRDVPYKLSVVQISTAVASPEAEAPTPPPPVYNLTDLMTDKGGCGMFARFTDADLYVSSSFNSCIAAAGLTLFCPLDSAMIKFLPTWKKLKEHQRTNLLLYHSISMFNSLQQLTARSGHQHTIAGTSAGTSMYNFTVKEVKGKSRKINILTKINTATITSTVVDQQPLAIYAVDKVLKPRELFKVADADAPAPAPPAKKKKKGSAHSSTVDSDYDYEDDDDTADKKNAAARAGGWRAMLGAAAAVAVGGLALF